MMDRYVGCVVFLLFFCTAFHSCCADDREGASFSEFSVFNRSFSAQRAPAWHLLGSSNVTPMFTFVLTGVLSFMAAVIASVGGLGGGGLFMPILTIVTGLDLKTASSYSAFMVTGGSISNVGYRILYGNRKRSGKQLINYDVALLTEPCMLLGVSCGVICNRIFPEWLITIIFTNFLAFSTFKTCKSGILYWKSETEGIRGNECLKFGSDGDDSDGSAPLLEKESIDEVKSKTPWMTLGMLIIIWISFLLLYLLRGNRYGQGIIHIQACGSIYWIISSIQIPLAVIFTALILCSGKGGQGDAFVKQENGGGIGKSSAQSCAFPIMALLAGLLGGVFGVGGGMLISPLLLQLGMEPKETAATCSFMVLFSSSMSAIQYLLLGMEDIYGALTYAVICFVASIVGLILAQNAIMKHGRASIIVFCVGTVMAISTVLITGFGAVDIWKDYISGKSMGFKPPC